MNTKQKSYLNYLANISLRICYMHKLLKRTGSFYLHCDTTASHYLKIILDCIFGIANFKNEIIWERIKNTGGPKSVSKYFVDTSDIILFYKNGGTHTWNPLKKQGSEQLSLDRFKYDDNDGKGRYLWEKISLKGKTNFDKFCENHDIKITNQGVHYYKKYLKDVAFLGSKLSNVWTDIGKVTNCDYPTQKPKALLERIILASSNEGDLIGDFYLGSGTTAIVSKALNRNFIGSDISEKSIKIVNSKLEMSSNTLNLNKETSVNIYHKDCLELLKDLDKQHSKGFIDLIYIDPPFNSGYNYYMGTKSDYAGEVAFTDIWDDYDATNDLEEIKVFYPKLYNFLLFLQD